MRSMLKLACAGVTLVMVGAVMTGCRSSGSYHDPYFQPWYDVYGNYCGDYPGPQCNYYWDGLQMIDLEDPYFNSYDYFLEFGDWFYYDTFGFPSFYLGWAWLSPSGILYDEWGNALNEKSEEENPDWDAVAAEQTEGMIKKVGADLTERMALNDARMGVHIARTLNNWATLIKERKSRKRTPKDIKATGELLYGVDVEEAVKALAKAKDLEDETVIDLNDQVAHYWGTTPETAQEVMKGWYKKQLSDMGLE